MFRSCLQHCCYSCRVWPVIECRCGAVMSGGSGTGYPVMNRGPCCAQTGRSERKRGMGVGNKTILLFLGRRVFFFLFLFFSFCRCKLLLELSCEFSLELHHLLRTRQLGASGASGSRSVFCQLSVMKKEKQLRELWWGGQHISWTI